MSKAFTHHEVAQVIDGDTFDVSPPWSRRDQTGQRVRPAGYDAPELHTDEGKKAKRKLETLILGKTVSLGPALSFDRGRLVCKVIYQGRDLASYFPEYQDRRHTA